MLNTPYKSFYFKSNEWDEYQNEKRLIITMNRFILTINKQNIKFIWKFNLTLFLTFLLCSPFL